MTERRHLDFSMKEVAERAGVSLRTVYNHFPTREDLLDALGRTFNDESDPSVGGPVADDLASGEDLLRAVRVNIELFEALGGISEAFAQMPLADVGRDAGAGRAHQAHRRLIAGPDADRPEPTMPTGSPSCCATCSATAAGSGSPASTASTTEEVDRGRPGPSTPSPTPPKPATCPPPRRNHEPRR